MRISTVRFVFVLAAIALFALAQHVRAHDSPSAAATKRIVCQVFGPNCSKAIAIVRCETGGTFSRWAVNWKDVHSDGSRGSFGVFQIGALHRASGESVASFRIRMADVYANSRLAYRLSRGGTRWGPWANCA